MNEKRADLIDAISFLEFKTKAQLMMQARMTRKELNKNLETLDVVIDGDNVRYTNGKFDID